MRVKYRQVVRDYMTTQQWYMSMGRYPRLRNALMALVLTSVEAFLAVLCIFAAVPILVAPLTFAGPALVAALPLWMIYMWGVSLLIGGGLSLFGIVASVLRIERMGVAVLATVPVIYALALIAAPTTPVLTIAIYLMFSMAMVARYWVLGKALSAINELIKEMIQARTPKTE